MSRYDGLIIPRSYSEYINKTDAATLQQALQLSGVLSGAVAAGDNKAVKSSAVNNALANYAIKSDVEVVYENITSECSVINGSVTLNNVYAYKQGNRVSLTFDVVTNGNNYAIVNIPQRYTPRNADFNHQWWNYSKYNQTVVATLNQGREFYVMCDSTLPAGVSIIQTFDFYI